MLYIVGPTASGKTALAVHIASVFNCEIISADSRQVYKYMDIGTGKDLGEYGDIKYHCIDLVDPKTDFNLSKYIKAARKAKKDIEKHNKIPLVAGGTGLYINSLIKGYNGKTEKIDTDLRNELLKLSKEELQKRLLKEIPNIREEINNSDFNNPHRLIRYIEKSINNTDISYDKNLADKDAIVIGISVDKGISHQKIYTRLLDRLLNEDMLKEVYDLHYKHKVSWKRLESFGLEYRFISEYLRKKIKEGDLSPYLIQDIQQFPDDLQQLINNLSTAIYQYAKRQVTWFKKTPNIVWFDGNDKKKLYKEVEKFIREKLKKQK